MTQDLKPLKLFTVNNSQHINEICGPFFQNYNINYFSYGRFYDDGSFYVLLTNPDWYDHFWDRKFPIAVPKAENFVIKQSLLYLWDDELYSEAVHDAKRIFSMDHGITLVNRCLGYFEYFSFASPVENNKAISFYLNSLSVLESFGRYFSEKASELIQDGFKNRIVLPNESEIINIIPPDNNFDSFNKQYAIKTIKEIKFTPKELDCLQLLKKGFTAKEIGAQLFLSPRTIHDYIDRIKEKLGVQKKSQIITMLEKTVKSTVG